MIRLLGAAFTTAADGDQLDAAARTATSAALGIADAWAVADQVHGAAVAIATGPGSVGGADGIVTTTPGLPVAVRTADCAGIVLHGAGVVGVAHAGWRGAVAGVLPAVIEAMEGVGTAPTRAVVGPHIGPCCFEVGAEVAAELPDAVRATSWGTTSVDLAAALEAQLGGVTLHRTGGCTRCGAGWLSHRADGTPARLAAIGWLP